MVKAANKRFRWRCERTHSNREWAFGIGCSLWPLPKPTGMRLYVVHFLWWNLVLESQ